MRAIAVALVLGAIGPLPFHAAAQVRLELEIPQRHTHVIGDGIPLHWEFTNLSDQPMGFMWEGCCRMNGRIDVTTAEGAVPTVPPVQALAHMFARADRLVPGAPAQYETKVSDWVLLPESGTYRLQGTYRGVLPFQSPQIPRGLGLWTNSARSAPVTLTVLSPADYLARSSEHARARGIRMALEGPSRLDPLRPATFRLSIENLADAPASLRWPDDFSVWVLNDVGQRSVPAAALRDPTSTFTVPPRSIIQREFEIEPDRFEGEPLGDYRMFIDLAETDELPRVPSAVLAVQWRLEAPEVEALLSAAASGAGTGARNAPLRMLRVYLAESGPELERLSRSAADPAARDLAGRLTLAARLKPIAPEPGRVDLRLAVPPAGPPRWEDERVRSVVASAGDELGAQLQRLSDLRRHLGWDLGIELAPHPATPVARIVALAGGIRASQGFVGRAPEILIETGGTNAPARISVPASAVGDRPTVRIAPGAVSVSREGASFTEASDAAAIRRVLGDSPAAATRILAVPEVPWDRIREVLTPVVRPASRWELVPDTPAASGG